jgi:hypothetical protein
MKDFSFKGRNASIRRQNNGPTELQLRLLSSPLYTTHISETTGKEGTTVLARITGPEYQGGILDYCPQQR